jgi:hypothetical protein
LLLRSTHTCFGCSFLHWAHLARFAPALSQTLTQKCAFLVRAVIIKGRHCLPSLLPSLHAHAQRSPPPNFHCHFLLFLTQILHHYHIQNIHQNYSQLRQTHTRSLYAYEPASSIVHFGHCLSACANSIVFFVPRATSASRGSSHITFNPLPVAVHFSNNQHPHISAFAIMINHL